MHLFYSDPKMDLPSHLLAIAPLLLLGLLLWYRYIGRQRTTPTTHMRPPEPAGAWPIIGHLHHLLSRGGKVRRPVFRTLAAMADKLGPVFVIRLGAHRTVVVSSHEMAKECFTTNDKIFASRPNSAAAKILGYNSALFGLAPYGPLWRELRKLSIMELLSGSRVNELMHVQVSELVVGVKELYTTVVEKDQEGNGPRKVVIISDWFEHLNFNIVLRMIAGKRYFDNLVHGTAAAAPPVTAMKKAMSLVGAIVASDLLPFPFLEWLDLEGHLSDMKRVSKEMDLLLESWIEEHKWRRRVESGGDNDNKDRQNDFIDVLLTKFEHVASLFGHSSHTVIKDMIVAGTQGTSIAFSWVFSALLNNRHVMKEAQEEIDLKVGRDRWVEPYDIPNLVYLQAIMKETLRLYPPGPLLIPHEAMEDCHLGGYHIPKGTHLMVNTWKLHRDPAIWSDPEEFQPERFLTRHANLDVFGQHFELIPFGSGRRSCPGINMALQMVNLITARLLQGFEMTTPSNSPVDMTEAISITMPKATPLEVMLTPRLCPQLYN